MKIGEGDKWLEILGCGMVHPNVLKNAKVNSKQYQGYAWSWNRSFGYVEIWNQRSKSFF